jgi:hypothetical protein
VRRLQSEGGERMTRLEIAINTLEHISTTSISAAEMRRIIRHVLLQQLYPERNDLMDSRLKGEKKS